MTSNQLALAALVLQKGTSIQCILFRTPIIFMRSRLYRFLLPGYTAGAVLHGYVNTVTLSPCADEGEAGLYVCTQDGCIEFVVVSSEQTPHPYFLESNRFDRMENPVLTLSASSISTACVDTDARFV